MFKDLSNINEVQIALKFADKLWENTSEGVVITDINGTILTVNPAFEIVTGYKLEEARGKNLRLLKSGIHDQKFYENMWAEILGSGEWKSEIWNKRKDGEVYPEQLLISAVKDANGEITNFIAIFSDVSELKLSEEKLRRLAHFDTLTGVANRYSLTKKLQSLLLSAKTNEQQLAVLFLDLDRFKQINDTLGHKYGDSLLQEVSARLKGLIKDKDIIARLGGDEFVIILPKIESMEEASYIAKKIIESLSQSFFLNNHEVYISTSIGISLFPIHGQSMDILLRNADKAMYSAKSNGKNRYEYYRKEMHRDEAKKMKMETLLRKALKRGELFLVYHPKVSMKTKEIVGIEALLRWNSKELGIVSPGEFIPLAEETALIIPISEWLIKKACEDLKKIQLNGFPKMTISVNISALHFNQGHFLNSIHNIIKSTNVNPHHVELELTESMIMSNAKESIGKLVKLKQLGLKLSVDDFGTGYSSFNYLNRFPLDILKIDQTFIKKIGVYHEDTSIVKAIITMAHRLNLAVVAEGVENQRQWNFLLKEKCDLIQGFYITEPLPYEDIIALLKNWDKQLLKS